MAVLRPTRGCRYYARQDLPERGLKALDEIPVEMVSEAHAFQFWQAGVFGVIDERDPTAHCPPTEAATEAQPRARRTKR